MRGPVFVRRGFMCSSYLFLQDAHFLNQCLESRLTLCMLASPNNPLLLSGKLKISAAIVCNRFRTLFWHRTRSNYVACLCSCHKQTNNVTACYYLWTQRLTVVVFCDLLHCKCNTAVRMKGTCLILGWRRTNSFSKNVWEQHKLLKLKA